MAKFSLKRFSIFLICLSLFSIGMYRYQETGDNLLDIWASYAIYPFVLVQKSINAKILKLKRKFDCIEILNSELENMKTINQDLLSQNIQLQSIKDFIYQTEEIREFATRYSKKGTLAQILLKDLNDQHQFFLVDAGTNKSIKLDMIAIFKDCLVGRISEVYPEYSKITLITDKSCKVAAYCSKSKVSGINEGLNKLDLTKLSYINNILHMNPQALELNDLVLSSGEGLIFPKGFALGRIKEFRLDGLNYDISIEPILDFKVLTYCYIMPQSVGVN